MDRQREPEEDRKLRKQIPDLGADRIQQTLNDAAFQKLLPELEKEFPAGAYIALVKGKRVDTDSDNVKLAVRVNRNHPARDICIRRIGKPERPQEIDDETLNRPFTDDD